MPWGVAAAAVGAYGAIEGGKQKSKAAKHASQQALEGYDYLRHGAGADASNQYINSGQTANSAITGLLGIGGDPQAAQDAFNNYLGSTGYQFQLGQGQDAVNSNMAARGLLNSGATGKALTKYGQNLASTTFNNYLNRLGSVQDTGQGQLNQVAAAGGNGGANAGQYTAQAGADQAAGLNGALGYAANYLGGISRPAPQKTQSQALGPGGLF